MWCTSDVGERLAPHRVEGDTDDVRKASGQGGQATSGERYFGERAGRRRVWERDQTMKADVRKQASRVGRVSGPGSSSPRRGGGGNEEPSWSQAARAKCSGWQRVFSLAPCYRKLSSQNEADSAQRPINASSVLSKRGGPLAKRGGFPSLFSSVPLMQAPCSPKERERGGPRSPNEADPCVFF